MRLAFILAASAVLATPAFAAPCRDAKGHFIKCPTVQKTTTATRCRDAKGHFAKCGIPGTKPA